MNTAELRKLAKDIGTLAFYAQVSGSESSVERDAIHLCVNASLCMQLVAQIQRVLGVVDLERCRKTCPHLDRCSREVGHADGCNHKVCTCNDENKDLP